MRANDDIEGSRKREMNIGEWYFRYHIWNGEICTVDRFSTTNSKGILFRGFEAAAFESLCLDVIDAVLKTNESSLFKFLAEHDEQLGEDVK